MADQQTRTLEAELNSVLPQVGGAPPPQDPVQTGVKKRIVEPNYDAAMAEIYKQHGFTPDQVAQEVKQEQQDEMSKKQQEAINKILTKEQASVGGEEGKALGETLNKMVGENAASRIVVGGALGLGRILEKAVNTGIDAYNAMVGSTKQNTGDVAADFEFFKEAVKTQPQVGRVSSKLVEYGAPAVAATVAGAPAGMAIAADAAIQFVTTDPEDDRLADTLKDTPIRNYAIVGPVIEYLAKDATETPLEARWKTTLEGAGIASAVAGIFAGARGIKAAGKEAATAVKAAESVTPPPAAVTDDIVARADEAVTAKADIVPPEQLNLMDQEWAKGFPENTPTANNTEYTESLGRLLQAIPDIEQARGPMTFEEIRTMGGALAEDVEFVQSVVGREAGDIWNAEASAGAGQLFGKVFDDMERLAVAADAPAATAADMAALDEGITNLLRMNDRMVGNASEQGRALGMNAARAQMINAGDAEVLAQVDKQMKALIIARKVESAGGLQAIKDKAALIREAFAEAKAAQVTVDATGAIRQIGKWESFMDGLTSYVLNNRLSSPKTIMNAVTGGIVGTVQRGADNLTAALISPAFKSDDAAVTLGQVYGDAMGMSTSIFEAMNVAGKSLRTGQAVGPVVRGDIQALKPSALPRIENAPNGLQFLAEVWNTTGAVMASGRRMLLSQDAFFGTVNYRGYVYGQAYKAAQNVPAAERADFIAKFVADPPKEIHDAAKLAASEVALNAPLSSEWLRTVDEGIESGAKYGTKLLFPFFKTTGNLIERTAERFAPTAPFVNSWREDMLAGGARRQMATAKVINGTATIGALMYLYQNGLVTGPAPKDGRTARLLETSYQGWQPYSVLANGKYHNIRTVDLLSKPLAIAAYLEAGREHMDEATWGELVAIGGMAMAQTLTPQQQLQTVSMVSDLVTGILGGEDVTTTAGNVAGNLATGAIPMSALVNDIRNQTDRFKADTRSLDGVLTIIKNKVENAVPGMSQNLPIQVNIFGEDLYTNRGTFGAFSPFYTKDQKGDQVTEVLRQLSSYYDIYDFQNKATKLSINEMPRELTIQAETDSMGNKIGGIKVPLTPNEYAEMQRIAGAGLKDALHDQFFSDSKSSIRAYIRKFEQDGYLEPIDYERIVGTIHGEILRRRTAAQAELARRPDIIQRAEQIRRARQEADKRGLREIFMGGY